MRSRIQITPCSGRMPLAGTLIGGALALAGLTGLPVQDVQARARYETCQSRYDRYQYCRTDTRGGVRLQRQISKSDCIQGETWGYDRGGIWVDRGCRAEFVIGSDGGYDQDYDRYDSRDDGQGPNNSRWRGNQQFVCDARGDGYRLCRADTRGGVRLIRQLSKSPCRLNDSWGYERDGVWVDKGCRAEFVIGAGYDDDRSDARDRNNPPPAAVVGGAIALGVLGAIAANQDKDRDRQIVTCNSRYNERNYCPVDTRGGVRLHRQLSKSDCRQNQTWGYDRGGIWVDDGCRAEFEIR